MKARRRRSPSASRPPAARGAATSAIPPRPPWSVSDRLRRVGAADSQTAKADRCRYQESGEAARRRRRASHSGTPAGLERRQIRLSVAGLRACLAHDTESWAAIPGSIRVNEAFGTLLISLCGQGGRVEPARHSLTSCPHSSRRPMNSVILSATCAFTLPPLPTPRT